MQATMSLIPILAHFGHWTTSLAFFGPVLALPVGLYIFALFQRRKDRHSEPPRAD